MANLVQWLSSDGRQIVDVVDGENGVTGQFIHYSWEDGRRCQDSFPFRVTREDDTGRLLVTNSGSGKTISVPEDKVSVLGAVYELFGEVAPLLIPGIQHPDKGDGVPYSY